MPDLSFALFLFSSYMVVSRLFILTMHELPLYHFFFDPSNLLFAIFLHRTSSVFLRNIILWATIGPRHRFERRVANGSLAYHTFFRLLFILRLYMTGSDIWELFLWGILFSFSAEILYVSTASRARLNIIERRDAAVPSTPVNSGNASVTAGFSIALPPPSFAARFFSAFVSAIIPQSVRSSFLSFQPFRLFLPNISERSLSHFPSHSVSHSASGNASQDEDSPLLSQESPYPTSLLYPSPYLSTVLLAQYAVLGALMLFFSVLLYVIISPWPYSKLSVLAVVFEAGNAGFSASQAFFLVLEQHLESFPALRGTEHSSSVHLCALWADALHRGSSVAALVGIFMAYPMRAATTPIDVVFVFLLPFALYSLYASSQRAGRFARSVQTLRRVFRDAKPEDIPPGENCSICMEVLDAAKVLQCGHMLHLACLWGLIRHSDKCPVCRQPLTSSTNVFNSRPDSASSPTLNPITEESFEAISLNASEVHEVSSEETRRIQEFDLTLASSESVLLDSTPFQSNQAIADNITTTPTATTSTITSTIIPEELPYPGQNTPMLVSSAVEIDLNFNSARLYALSSSSRGEDVTSSSVNSTAFTTAQPLSSADASISSTTLVSFYPSRLVHVMPERSTHVELVDTHEDQTLSSLSVEPILLADLSRPTTTSSALIHPHSFSVPCLFYPLRSRSVVDKTDVFSPLSSIDVDCDVNTNNIDNTNNVVDAVDISALYPKHPNLSSKKPEPIVESHFVSRPDPKNFTNSPFSSSFTVSAPVSSLAPPSAASTAFTELNEKKLLYSPMEEALVEEQDLSRTSNSLSSFYGQKVGSDADTSCQKQGQVALSISTDLTSNAINQDVVDNFDIYSADLVLLTLLPVEMGESNDISTNSFDSVILNIDILIPILHARMLSSQESEQIISNANDQLRQTSYFDTVSNNPPRGADLSISTENQSGDAEVVDVASMNLSTPFSLRSERDIEIVRSRDEADDADDVNGEEEELTPIVTHPLTASMEYQRTIFSFSSAYLLFWDIFFPPFSFEIMQSHHGPPFILFAPLEGEEIAE